jgi:hypothetical protein
MLLPPTALVRRYICVHAKEISSLFGSFGSKKAR